MKQLSAIFAVTAALAVTLTVPVGAASVLVDNSDAGAVFTGGWSSSSSTGGYYGASYHHNGQNAGTSAQYTGIIPSAGEYSVYATWTENNNRHENVQYTVNHAGGSDTHTESQKNDGGQWNLLGSYNFNPGNTSVTIGASNPTDGYIIADGIRWVSSTVGQDYLPFSQLAAYASSSINSTNRAPARVIDGSGMDDSALLPEHDTNAYGADIAWMSANNDATGWVVVELEKALPLTGMSIWNYPGTDHLVRSVRTADIYASTSSAVDPANADFSDGNWSLVHDDVALDLEADVAVGDVGQIHRHRHYFHPWLRFVQRPR